MPDISTNKIKKVLKSISIILPVYNEEGNICATIESILNTLPALTDDFEIILVDDGSSDKTPEIIVNLKQASKYIKVIRHTRNKGYGAALISGIQAVKKELVFIMDADRQFNISQITSLIPYIEDFDIVAGFRIKRKDSFYRLILGRCFNFVIRVLFGIKLKDINCGFKLFKTDLFSSMNLITTGALINTEIMALATKNKARIKEIGVNHYPRARGKQSGGSFRVISKSIRELLCLRWRIAKVK